MNRTQTCSSVSKRTSWLIKMWKTKSPIIWLAPVGDAEMKSMVSVCNKLFWDDSVPIDEDFYTEVYGKR